MSESTGWWTKLKEEYNIETDQSGAVKTNTSRSGGSSPAGSGNRASGDGSAQAGGWWSNLKKEYNIDANLRAAEITDYAKDLGRYVGAATGYAGAKVAGGVMGGMVHGQSDPAPKTEQKAAPRGATFDFSTMQDDAKAHTDAAYYLKKAENSANNGRYKNTAYWMNRMINADLTPEERQKAADEINRYYDEERFEPKTTAEWEAYARAKRVLWAKDEDVRQYADLVTDNETRSLIQEVYGIDGQLAFQDPEEYARRLRQASERESRAFLDDEATMDYVLQGRENYLTANATAAFTKRTDAEIERANRSEAHRAQMKSYTNATRAALAIEQLAQQVDEEGNSEHNISGTTAQYLIRELAACGVDLSGMDESNFRTMIDAARTENGKKLALMRGTLAGEGYDVDAILERIKYDREKEYQTAREESYKAWAQRVGTGDAIAASLASVGESVLLKPLEAMGTFSRIADGAGVNNPNEYVPLVGQLSEADMIRNALSGEMSPIGRFFYNAVMSTADSTGNVMAFGGTGSLIMMGLTAAGTQAEAILQQGGSRGQAIRGGIAAGLIEILTEKFSVENLIHIKADTKTMRELLKSVGVQMFTEGSEEIAGEVLDILVDSVNMGNLSDNSEAVRRYINQGLTYEDAKLRVLMDNAMQIAESGAAGAVSGGLSGGAFGAYGTVKNRAAQNQYDAMMDKIEQRGFQSGVTMTEEQRSQAVKQLQERAQELKRKGDQIAAEQTERFATGVQNSGESLRALQDAALENNGQAVETHQEGRNQKQATQEAGQAAPAEQGQLREVYEQARQEMSQNTKSLNDDMLRAFAEAVAENLNNAQSYAEASELAQIEGQLAGLREEISRREAVSRNAERVAAAGNTALTGKVDEFSADWEGSREEETGNRQQTTVDGRQIASGAETGKRIATGPASLRNDNEGGLVARAAETGERIATAPAGPRNDNIEGGMNNGTAGEGFADGNTALTGKVDEFSANWEGSRDTITDNRTDARKDNDNSDTEQDVRIEIATGDRDDSSQYGAGKKADRTAEQGGLRNERQTGEGADRGETERTGTAGQVSLSAGERGGYERGSAWGVSEETRRQGKSREQQSVTRARQQAAEDNSLISPEELGAPMGAEDQTCRILSEYAWDDEIRNGVEYAMQNGIRKVTVVVGLLQVEVDGEQCAVNGIINKETGELFVRADSNRESFSEIVEHEVGHLKTNAAKVRAFMEAVKRRYNEAAWQAMYDTYERRYADVTEDYAGMSAEEKELYVWEEIQCDAAARSNKYGARADAYHSEAAETLNSSRSSWETVGPEYRFEGGRYGSREISAATDRTNGPGEPPGKADRYSVDWAGSREENENARQGRAGARFSILEDAKTEIDQLISGQEMRGSIVLTDGTPSIMLGHNGVRNLQLAMKPSHIRENILTENEARALGLRIDDETHYHGLGKKLFYEVIDQLNDVTEAYRGTKNAKDPARRENYFFLVTKFKDSDGNLINVPVYINTKSDYHQVYIDTNTVGTVFGREDLRDYINRQLNQKNLVRIKKRGNTASERTGHTPDDYSGTTSASRVAQTEQDVKTIEKENPDAVDWEGNRGQRHSPSEDSDEAYLAAVERGDTETAQRMVDEAAKRAGYDMHLYHGSRAGGGFTVFKDWQYFTPNKEYAERYMQRDNPDSLYDVYVKSERMFDTRRAECRDIFERMREEYGLSELQENGLPDWTDGYDISDFIEENGLDYDGVVLDEGGDLTEDGPVSRGVSYIIRNSEQVKSAKPVTRDKNNKPILLSERFRTDRTGLEEWKNRDIRFSQSEKDELDSTAQRGGGLAPYDAQNDRTEAGSSGIKLNRKELLARWELRKEVMDIFNIAAGSRQRIGDEIADLADRLIQEAREKGVRNVELSDQERRELYRKLYDAGIETAQAEEYYRNIRDRLKGAHIFVDEQTRADFGDDYDAFRRKAWGNNIYLTADTRNQSADMLNAELAEEFPGVVDRNETDPRTMLENLVDLAEKGKNEKLTNDESIKRNQEMTGERPVDVMKVMRWKADRAINDFLFKLGNGWDGMFSGGKNGFSQVKAERLEELSGGKVVNDRAAWINLVGTYGEKTLRDAGFTPAPREQTARPAKGKLNTEELIGTLNAAGDYGTSALQEIGVKVEGSVGDFSKVKALIANDKAARSVQKQVRKAENRLKRGVDPKQWAREQQFAAGIASGVYAKEDIPQTFSEERVLELADYYAAERATKNKMIQQRRTEIRKTLDGQMQELFKDADQYESSSMLVLNERTPDRNMRHIFGDELGEQINKAIFYPVQKNEAERIRFVNRMHDAVRTFQDTNGKQSKLTKAERVVVQMLMEGKGMEGLAASAEVNEAVKGAAEQIAEGKQPKYVFKDSQLGRQERETAVRMGAWMAADKAMKSGKLDTVRVNNAVSGYTKLYNQLYEAINDFLVAHGYEPIGFIKNYAPHIQPEETQNLMQKAFQHLGINAGVTELPASIAGLTSDYKPSKRWNPHFLERSGNITEYDAARGFEEYINYVSDIFYHMDDTMRVRQAVKYFRETFAPENIKATIEKAHEARSGSYEEKMAYLWEQDEIGKASMISESDIDAVFEDYMQKLYDRIQKTTKHSNLAMWLDNYANLLAGKQSFADRGQEYSFGRKMANFGNRLVRVFGSSKVAGNLSSVLNQGAQLPMIKAELGTRWTTGAILDVATGKLRRAAWWQQSDFLTGKHGIEYIVKTPGEMVTQTLFKPAELMDALVSTIAVRGKYLQQIHKGMSHEEAMRAADKFGREVMGSREKGTRPLAYSSKGPVSQMVHIFQVEAINSWEHLTQDLPRDFREISETRGKGKAALALAGVIVKMLLTAFALNRIDDEIYGGSPAPFDMFGLSMNFIASGEGLTTNEWIRTVIDNGLEKITGQRLFGTDADEIGDEEFNWSAALEDTAYNISNDVPFIRNLAGLMGWGDKSVPMPDVVKKGKEIVNAISDHGLISPEAGKAALKAGTELLPGGNQINKTAQGIEAVLRGGDFSGYGENEKLKYPLDDNALTALRAILFGKYATKESDAYYASGDNMLTVKQTQLWQSLIDSGIKRQDAYKAIQDFRDISSDKDLSSFARGQQQRNMIKGLSWSDENKTLFYHTMVSDSKDDEIKALRDVGLGFDKFLDIQNAYAKFNSKLDNAGEKATAFAQWVNQQGYSPRQKVVINENFKYWRQLPASAGKYTDFIDAGMDDDDAMALQNALGELVPENGKDQVSNLQKYQTVIAAGLNERDQMAALSAIMQESEYRKLKIGNDYGLTPSAYVNFKAIMPDYDEDKNGSYTQEEVKNALKAMSGLSDKQRAVLWQISNKSWKAKNNPFNADVGQNIYEELNAD